MSYIAAIGAIIASAIAAKQGGDQQKAQEQMAARSGYLGERELALAREAQRQGLATKIDAQGNVVFYDEATNSWQTFLSRQGQQMQDASDRESYTRMTDDQTMGRAGRMANYGRRGTEGLAADAELQGYQDDRARGGAYSPEAIAAELRLSRGANVNAGFDQAQNIMGMQMARSNGASGDAGMLTRLARARAQSLQQQMGNPNIEAMQMAGDMNNNQANSGMNRYNLLAARAGNLDDVAFQPTNINGPTSALQAQGQQAGLAGITSAAGITSNSRRGDLATPLPGQNTYLPDMISGLGELFRDKEDDVLSFLGNFNKKRTVIDAPRAMTVAQSYGF